MTRFKKILRRALYPHTAVFLPVAALAAFSLAYVFAHGLDAHPVSYAVYMLSFYALCVVCANAVRLAKNIKKYLHQNAYTERYLSDAELRARISLYAGTLTISDMRYSNWLPDTLFFLDVWRRRRVLYDTVAHSFFADQSRPPMCKQGREQLPPRMENATVYAACCFCCMHDCP